MITAAFASVEVNEYFPSEEEQNSKEFKLKFVTGAFPVLENQDGILFESAAIAKYFARLNPSANLSGQNLREQAEIDQWSDFAKCSIVPALRHVMSASFGWGRCPPAELYNDAVKELKEHAKILNMHL
jgi:glutathione S-transferase